MKICTLLGNCCDYIVFNFRRNQARIDDFRVLVALFIKQTKYVHYVIYGKMAEKYGLC